MVAAPVVPSPEVAEGIEMAESPKPTVTMPDRDPGEPIHQWVFRALRRAIMTGHFPPGQAVTIRGLAESMNVSAMPVRDALRRLVAERALELLDNRRVRVPSMTTERFDELLTARIALETEAAARALPLIDETRLRELHAIDDRINRADAEGAPDTVVEQNFHFHHTLYMARPGSIFVPLIESVWLQTGPFMRVALEETPSNDPIDRHVEALAAIAERNPAALRRAIEADIRDGIGHLGNTGLLVREQRPPGGLLSPGGSPRRAAKIPSETTRNAREAELP
jgi:DNA-binding GntR family transcriptional regulator